MTKFWKYEGLGNDFIIPMSISLPDSRTVDPLHLLDTRGLTRWSRLCDRRLSVGGDGVLLHYHTADKKDFMYIINQDGTVAEMCGNGLRCMVLHLHLQSNRQDSEFTIETLAGSMRATLHSSGIRCQIGPAKIQSRMHVDVGERRYHGYWVNTGNPHFVIFDHVSNEIRNQDAPLLSTHPKFPDGANISFADLHSDSITLSVYERGCGWTQACGTAAVATTAASWAMQSIESVPTIVHLPGGTLTISGTFSDMTMDGPARLTFEGQIADGH